MTQRQLEIFTTLAETLNFTRTSEYLYLSQTTVTLQIKNLEEELGVPLFVRTSRSVRLTAAGKVFQERAVKILKEMEDATEEAMLIGKEYTGLLEVGFATEANATGISSLFDQFIRRNPEIRLRVYGGYPGELLDHLVKERFDLILGPAFENLKSGELHTHVIGRYPLVAVFRKDHPFAKKKSVRFSDFEGEKMIYLSDPNRQLDFTSEFSHKLQEKNIRAEVVATIDDIESVLIMMEAGIGISVIPEYFKGRFHGTSGLKTCRIDEKLKGVAFTAMWRRGKLSPELSRFISQLKESFPAVE